MLVLDIETYKDVADTNYVNWKLSGVTAPGNYKDPASIERYVAEQKVKEVSKFALSPLTGKIILIGMLTDKVPSLPEDQYTKYMVGEKNTPVYYIGLADTDEKTLLSRFWQIFSWFNLNDSPLVSFNGKAFDLPFILHRTLITKALIPRKISIDQYLAKYKNSPHFDLFNWFGGSSLVEWSYRFGITDSLQRDGNKIGDWYEQGQMNLIIDKNKLDIAQTLSLYNAVKDWL
jgi:hypothetical protein